MDTYKIIKEMEAIAKKVLYYAYNTSETFPASCGLVSGLLAKIIYKEELLPEYDVYYIRGLHLDRNNSSEKCSFNRNTKEIPCNDCKFFCDAVIEHSWVELVEKKTEERIILDYTSVQFDEESFLIEECLHEEDFNMDSLYKFLDKNSHFLITEQDSSFQKYIPYYKQVKDGEKVEHVIQEMENWFKRERGF